MCAYPVEQQSNGAFKVNLILLLPLMYFNHCCTVLCVSVSRPTETDVQRPDGANAAKLRLPPAQLSYGLLASQGERTFPSLLHWADLFVFFVLFHSMSHRHISALEKPIDPVSVYTTQS